MAGIEITSEFRMKVERDALTLGYGDNAIAWRNLGIYWEKQKEGYDESQMDEIKNALLAAYVCYENALKLNPKDGDAKKGLQRVEKALKKL